MRLRTTVLALAALGATAALPACDSDVTDPTTITFDGVEIQSLGTAQFQVENDRLVVTNIGASGDDGVGIWQGQASTYLTFEPIDLPAGGSFGITVRDANDEFLTSIFSEDNGDGRHDIVFNVADRIGVQAVTLQYLLLGELIIEIPNFPISGGQALKAETAAGRSDGDNGSVRVIRVGGRYVVGQDYSGSGDPLVGTDDAGTNRKGVCPYAVITLPVPVGDLTQVCADLVQVVIEDPDLPSTIRGTAITGRRLDQFVITDVQINTSEG